MHAPHNVIVHFNCLKSFHKGKFDHAEVLGEEKERELPIIHFPLEGKCTACISFWPVKPHSHFVEPPSHPAKPPLHPAEPSSQADTSHQADDNLISETSRSVTNISHNSDSLLENFEPGILDRL